jgi:hypothetical protein
MCVVVFSEGKRKKVFFVLEIREFISLLSPITADCYALFSLEKKNITHCLRHAYFNGYTIQKSSSWSSHHQR